MKKNDEVNLENKKIKEIRNEQLQRIKDMFGEYRTDPDEIQRINKIFKNCKCPTIMENINKNKIVSLKCDECDILKAFPEKFISDKIHIMLKYILNVLEKKYETN